MVISDFAGTVVYEVSASLKLANTCCFRKAGIYFDTGSSNNNFPSSNKIMIATLVIAFVCEAMRKMSSFFKGTFASRSL